MEKSIEKFSLPVGQEERVTEQLKDQKIRDRLLSWFKARPTLWPTVREYGSLYCAKQFIACVESVNDKQKAREMCEHNTFPRALTKVIELKLIVGEEINVIPRKIKGVLTYKAEVTAKGLTNLYHRISGNHQLLTRCWSKQNVKFFYEKHNRLPSQLDDFDCTAARLDEFILESNKIIRRDDIYGIQVINTDDVNEKYKYGIIFTKGALDARLKYVANFNSNEPDTLWNKYPAQMYQKTAIAEFLRNKPILSTILGIAPYTEDETPEDMIKEEIVVEEIHNNPTDAEREEFENMLINGLN